VLDSRVVLSTQIHGTGRPLVVLPWFGFDHGVMEAAFEPVFAGITGWRRIYVDLPGTGASMPVEPSSDAVLAAVSETVSEIIGADGPALVAGCSYGGYLAAGLARRTPTLMSGLLLVCPGVKIRLGQRNLSNVAAASAQPEWLAEVPTEWHDHLAHGVGNQTAPVAKRLVDVFRLNGLTNGTYLEELRSKGYQLTDEASSLPFNGNVTILAGTQDRIVGCLDQFDTLSRYPHGTFVALGDTGHYLPFEQPELFTTLTLSWLSKAGATSG